MTGVTIMRLLFQKSYQNEVAHFRDFGVNESIESYDLGKFQSAHQLLYLDDFVTSLVPGILGSVKPGLYSCFDVIERDSLRTPFCPPFPRLHVDNEAIKRECLGTGLLCHQ